MTKQRIQTGNARGVNEQADAPIRTLPDSLYLTSRASRRSIESVSLGTADSGNERAANMDLQIDKLTPVGVKARIQTVALDIVRAVPGSYGETLAVMVSQNMQIAYLEGLVDGKTEAHKLWKDEISKAVKS